MLTIRQDQMDSFNAIRLESFITNVVEHLNEKFPDKIIEDQEAFRLDCKEGVKQATSYDIDAENDLMTYMEIRLQCGSNFDQKPWANSILTDSSLFPFEKIKALEEASLFILINEPS